MLEDVTAATFAPHVGETFRVHADDSTLDVELAAVTESDLANPRRTPFSLLFHGPLEPVLPQRTYRFEHVAVGPLEIFIVPIGPAGDAMRYEAVFA